MVPGRPQACVGVAGWPRHLLERGAGHAGPCVTVPPQPFSTNWHAGDTTHLLSNAAVSRSVSLRIASETPAQPEGENNARGRMFWQACGTPPDAQATAPQSISRSPVFGPDPLLRTHNCVLLLQDGKVELQAMVSGVSTDERAEHICVASHVTGPPHIVDFRDGSVRPLPSVAAGGMMRQRWMLGQCRESRAWESRASGICRQGRQPRA